jgi:hypothetical protein
MWKKSPDPEKNAARNHEMSGNEGTLRLHKSNLIKQLSLLLGNGTHCAYTLHETKP